MTSLYLHMSKFLWSVGILYRLNCFVLSSGKFRAQHLDHGRCPGYNCGMNISQISGFSSSPSNCCLVDRPLPSLFLFFPALQPANLFGTGTFVRWLWFSLLWKYRVLRFMLKLSKKTEQTSQSWLESQPECSESMCCGIQEQPEFLFTGLASPH